MVIDDYSITTLKAKNEYYAKFTTVSRLIMCLIHEGFVPAYFIKSNINKASNSIDGMIGLCLLLRISHRAAKGETESQDQSSLLSERNGLLPENFSITLDDIYAIVPLRAFPEFSSTSHKDTINLNGVPCHKIEFLCPWDMLPFVYGPSFKKRDTRTPSPSSIDTYTLINNSTNIQTQVFHILEKIGIEKQIASSALSEGYTSIAFWHRFSHDAGITHKIIKEISEELSSTINFQTYMYNHPKLLPTLQSSAVEWEQMSFEGDVNMPAYMSFINDPLIPSIDANDEHVTQLLKQPKLRLAAIPREDMHISGDFEQLLKPLVNAILSNNAEKDNETERQEWMKYSNDPDYIWIPINEIQVPVIQQYIKGSIILPKSKFAAAYTLTSPRTAACPDILSGVTIKYCINIYHSFKLLAMPREEIEFCHRLYQALNTNGQRLSYNRSILKIQPELANAYSTHPNEHVARQCTCVIRGSLQFESRNDKNVSVNHKGDNDVFIVGSALIEKIQKPDTDESLLIYAWKLDTVEKRAEFLKKYIKLFLRAFIPSCRDNGFVFESHLQNVTVRFDRMTGDIKGFLIRDLGGVDVHNETLKATCGIDFNQFSNTNYATYPTIEKLYQRWYNVAVYLHLYPMIHKLGMHHDGHGWNLVRIYFSELVPSSHPMYHYLMRQDKIPIRSILFTKIMSYDQPFVIDKKRSIPCPISALEQGQIDQRGCFYRLIPNFLLKRPLEGLAIPTSEEEQKQYKTESLGL